MTEMTSRVLSHVELLWNGIQKLENKWRFAGKPYPNGMASFPGKTACVCSCLSVEQIWISSGADFRKQLTIQQREQLKAKLPVSHPETTPRGKAPRPRTSFFTIRHCLCSPRQTRFEELNRKRCVSIRSTFCRYTRGTWARDVSVGKGSR
jgi:hypothetical protein